MEQPQANITSKVQSINLRETLDKRFCDLVFSLLGKSVKVRLPNNQEGEGIFYTINPQNGGVMVKNYQEQSNGYPGETKTNNQQNKNGSTKCLQKQDFIYLFAENVDEPPFIQDFQNLKNTKQIKTDGELTKLDKNRGREFQAVDFIFGESASLEDGEDQFSQKAKPSSFKNLDQFQINQQKFGVGTDFKEEEYTTKLDMNKVHKDDLERAEKLEQEVVKEGSKNKHVLIDRGRDDLLGDSDEEGHFSAVHGSGRFNQEGAKAGSKKEISSSSKLDQANQDSGINFGKGRPMFSRNKSEKEDKKEESPTKVDTSKKAETTTENKVEAPKQEEPAQQKQTEVKQTSSSQPVVFVEKVEPPKTVIPEPAKDEKQTPTTTNTAPTSSSLTTATTTLASSNAVTTTTEKPSEEKPKENGDGTSQPAAAAPAKKKLKLPQKTDFKIEQQPPISESNSQAPTSSNSLNNSAPQYEYQNTGMQDQQQQQQQQQQQYMYNPQMMNNQYQNYQPYYSQQMQYAPPPQIHQQQMYMQPQQPPPFYPNPNYLPYPQGPQMQQQQYKNPQFPQKKNYNNMNNNVQQQQ